jgi:hypothetical protein
MIYLGLIVGLFWAMERRVSVAALLVGGAGALVFGWALLRARELTATALASGMAGGAVLLHGAAYGIVIPALETIWVVPRVVAAVQRSADCAKPQLASAGLHEPSLVFLAGTSTALVSGGEAAQFLRGGDCRVAAIEKNEEPQFLAAATAAGQQPLLRERVTGIAIGRFRRVDIGVYTTAR